jgi:GH25 family lysozyme M1 (1,4-beta-N-acetylmuramidase)
MMAAAFVAASLSTVHADQPANAVWTDTKRALVLDGYEYNVFDLKEIAQNPRVAAFIHKGSDGMPPSYGCGNTANLTERELCKKDWKVYAVGRELFHARRALAKQLGLKWGAYHLARPGNPREQANHFLDFAEPAPDDLMALDLEDNDPAKFMSLSDAEEFARHIFRRTGRYPVLYTNGSTAKYIGEMRDTYPILSRLKLWYARYRPDIVGHFPTGNWENYTLWQFASHVNCNQDDCAYRIEGTGADIDINAASMSVEELKAKWPFDGLVKHRGPKTSRDWPHILVSAAKNGSRKFAGPSLAAMSWAKTNWPRRPLPHMKVPSFGIDMMETSSVTVAFYSDIVQRRCSRVISRQPISER